MMSSNEGGPPIAIPDFKGFLEGKPVDGYSDNGADVWMKIKQRFAQEMRSRFRMRVENKSSLPLWKVIDTTLHILADCIQFDVAVDDNIKEFIIQVLSSPSYVYVYIICVRKQVHGSQYYALVWHLWGCLNL